jgi:hypothetical protein
MAQFSIIAVRHFFMGKAQDEPALLELKKDIIAWSTISEARI